MSLEQQHPERPVKQQRQQMIVTASVIGVIGLAIVFVFIVLLNSEAPIPNGVDTAYADIPQSTTAESYGYLGDPEAPISIRVYSSFACVSCRDLAEDFDNLKRYMRNGQVSLEFVPIHSIGGLGADEGARAVVCAGEQGRFFEMHDVMFYWQGRENYRTALMESAAEQLDLNVDQFMSCYESRRAHDIVRQARLEFERLDFTGTPTVLVNGTRTNNPIGDVEALLQAQPETEE
ncbi:MAG: thioredoxin domain-containing protein [Chloroflexi bacterium]|nr:thioredoxin domain-containing protein [Chloroflexota bacterium]